jgi:16S rRNA processing protein RimM
LTEGAAPDLRIGRVLKPHGVRGGLRVESLTDFPDRFDAGRQVTVGGRVLTISRSQQSQGSLILNFAGIDNPEEAGVLRGAYITVPLSDARALPADRYYHFQLVGLSVIDNHDRKPLGTVEEVLTYPANDVLRVTGVGRERLVPMVSSVVLEVDLNEGQITVDLGEDTEA